MTPSRPYRLLHCSAATFAAWALQIGLWSWAAWAGPAGYLSWPERGLQLVVSLAVIAASFQLLNLSFRKRRRRLRQSLNLLLLLLYLLGFAYHFVTGYAPDFFFVAANAAEMQHASAWRMVGGAATTVHLCLLALLVMLAGWVAFGTSAFGQWPRARHRLLLLGGTLVGTLVVVVSPLYRHNDLTYFLRSAIDYAVRRHSFPRVAGAAPYPYVQRTASSADEPPPREARTPPHVFLIMLESFNHSFVGTRAEDGRALTPFFDSLRERGVYVERFYGNSVQTIRGQLATLCSVLPSIAGKVAVHHPELRLRCLPTILQEAGYRTVFFQGASSLEFDHTASFMKRVGFIEVHACEAAEEGRWGDWGVPDDVLYERVFSRLDELRRPDAGQRMLPVFATIATITHHFPFTSIPAEERELYAEPTGIEQRAANSIRLADRYLRGFFAGLAARDYLANSVVIVTSDHSFPIGEHDNYFNESGFYEENFRVPYVMVGGAVGKPRRVSDERTYSQLDVSPTIVDLLGIRTDHHFLGRSMLQAEAVEPGSALLVQPYDGTHLAVVRFPWKYVKSLRVPGEYLFHLGDDPTEQDNRIGAPGQAERIAAFEQELSRIYLNQGLIRDNRIWPPP